MKSIVTRAKNIVTFAIVIVTLATSSFAAGVKLTGTLRYPDGTGFNGSIEIRMARNGVVNTCVTPSVVVPTTTAVATVTNGTVNGGSLAIATTDCLSPRSAYYIRVLDSRRTIIYDDDWYVSPTDIASTEMNVGFLSPVVLMLTGSPPSPVTVTIPRAVVTTPQTTQTITQPVGTVFALAGGPMEFQSLGATPALSGAGNVRIYSSGSQLLASINGSAYAVMATGGSSSITGSGTSGTVAKWSSSTVLADSLITDNGTVVTFGGNIRAADGLAASPGISYSGATGTGFFRSSGASEIQVSWAGTPDVGIGSGRLRLSSGAVLNWTSSTSLGGTNDLVLVRVAANVLGLQNGTTAQGFNIYNTYTSGSVYETGIMQWSSNVLNVGTTATGGGTSYRNLKLTTDGGTNGWLFGAGSVPSITPVSDNAYTIGDATHRPAIYSTFLSVGLATNAATAGSNSNIYSGGDGTNVAILDTAGSSGQGGNLRFYKSNGSQASRTIVASGDLLGSFTAYGAASAGVFQPAGQIKWLVDGTPGAGTDMPGRMEIYTTPDGSATPALALTVNKTQNVVFTGHMLGADGDETAPTYSWSSETGTGFFRRASGTIGFSIGGVIRGVISSQVFSLIDPAAIFDLGPGDIHIARIGTSTIGFGGSFATFDNEVTLGGAAARIAKVYVGTGGVDSVKYYANGLIVQPPALNKNTSAYTPIANTTSETYFAIAGDGKITAGQINDTTRRIEIDLSGVYGAANNTDGMVVKVKLCTVSGCGSGTTVTIAQTGNVVPGTQTNAGWSLAVKANVFTAGAPGTIDAQGFATFGTAAATGAVAQMQTAGTSSVDTSVDQYLSVSVTWSGAGAPAAGDTITLRNLAMKIF